MDRDYYSDPTSRQNLFEMLFGGQPINEDNSSGDKRKRSTTDTNLSQKRRKAEGGAQIQLISYTTYSLTDPLTGNALYDHVINTATLLPPDHVLEPLNSYWFVSPVELHIRNFDQPLDIWATIHYKEYFLYLIFAKTQNRAEFYDTSDTFLALVTWRYDLNNVPSQTQPLVALFNSYQEVKDALGDNSSTTQAAEDMWKRFTKTDQYKQLTQNYNNNEDSNPSQMGTTMSYERDLPDWLKSVIWQSDTKPTQQPPITPANAQNSFYNPMSPPSTLTRQSDPFPGSYVPDPIEFLYPAAENQSIHNNANELRIPFSKIKLGEVIGEGSYGMIYSAEYNNKTHAIKRFKYYEAKKEDALKEAEVLTKLKHKHIVSLVGITTYPSTEEIMLVMEYMEKGSLEDLLVRDKVQLSREDVIKIGLDVAKGLHFLHSQKKKIIHRDLKGANVLLYEHKNKRRAKLSDFGNVRIFGESSKATTVTGTIGFMAPEILREVPYNEKADVYSFGRTSVSYVNVKNTPSYL